MRNFDHFGLQLAEFQAQLFEESVNKFNCSSLIFLRRFKKSNLANKLDEAKPNTLLDVNEGLKEISKQFGVSNYGNDKYSGQVMFWMGYIYRYISYTREISTKQAFDLISPKELSTNYYVYHTQSEEWVIERILDLKGKDDSFFDKNQKIKKILIKRYL